MVSPHPAKPSNPGLGMFLWRFFSGQHLDGIARTNATFFSYGTSPTHHLNWWSKKPIFHRMLIRWFLILAPVGVLVGYHYAPSYRMNLVVIILLAGFPYLFHQVTMQLVSLVPKVHVVIAHERLVMDEVSAELDEVTDIGDIIELHIPDEKNVSSRKRTNRRSDVRGSSEPVSGDESSGQ